MSCDPQPDDYQGRVVAILLDLGWTLDGETPTKRLRTDSPIGYSVSIPGRSRYRKGACFCDVGLNAIRFWSPSFDAEDDAAFGIRMRKSIAIEAKRRFEAMVEAEREPDVVEDDCPF